MFKGRLQNSGCILLSYFFKEISKGNQIKHDVFIDKILINDDMIVTTHKPYKEDYPNEYNIFNLDLKNIKLIRKTENMMKKNVNPTLCLDNMVLGLEAS